MRSCKFDVVPKQRTLKKYHSIGISSERIRFIRFFSPSYGRMSISVTPMQLTIAIGPIDHIL